MSTKEALQTSQAPLKAQYKDDPKLAQVTLTSTATLSDGISCSLGVGKAAKQVAGLHPMAGGKGDQLCSGDMLLEALAACTGVTLRAVSTSIDIPLGSDSTLTVEGDLDFSGTLGVSREAKVGFTAIRIKFKLDYPKEIDLAKIEKLLQLTERYCVVAQSISTPIKFSLV